MVTEFMCVILCLCMFVAAGKSTFLRLLEESTPKYRVVSEPLTRWCNVPCDGEVCSTCADLEGVKGWRESPAISSPLLI